MTLRGGGDIIENKFIFWSTIMKIRKMLRGIPLLFLMVSGLSVFLSCKAPSSNSTPTLYRVTFDAKGGAPIPPQSKQVEHGKTVEKPAPDPKKEPFAFGGWWYKNAQWNFATDTVTANITLYAQWKTTITFNPQTMECNKNNKPVNNGDTVYEGDELNFDAKLLKGELIDHWRVNGVDKNTKTAFHYTVVSNDVDNGTITVSYNTKKAAKATINFDSNKMTCTKDNNTTTVETGDEVYEKDLLFFTAKPATGKDVQWTAKVNGVEKKKEIRQYFSYTIKADDDKKTITVDYTEK